VTQALLARIEAGLPQAREAAALAGSPLLNSLGEACGLGPQALVEALAEFTGIRHITLVEMEQMRPDFGRITFSDCTRYHCIVLHDHDRTVGIVDDPTDPARATGLAYRIPGNFELAFAHPFDLQTLLARLETDQRALSQVAEIQADARSESRDNITLATIASESSEVVRLVDSTLYDGHKCGASDIHFENTSRGLAIRYRIDGVLSLAREVAAPAIAEQVVSRLKVLAELDIGERRIPQDGRFGSRIQGKEIDLRVSIMPGLFGEDAVLRILDKRSLSDEFSQLSLESLGLDPASCTTIRRLANQPHGMLLVTGPTGSGKTTTLYAALSEIRGGQDKIITIEDPVEYQLPDVLQIPVNEKKGLSFARGLRSILRHDPDRILVGEIRDSETAEIAIQAALTGHLVYTTVHANTAFDVVSRFRHMKVDLFSFVSALNGVVAQRLIRLNCPVCSVDIDPIEVSAGVAAYEFAALAGRALRAGPGCPACRGSGYKGRRALAEVLVVNDELREAILQQAPTRQLREIAQNNGTRLLRTQALDCVSSGQTTVEEINRVTFVA
jgi:general secretion pathway protein E